MGFKCAPQVMGLVRGEPKPGQKHRANGRKIAMEAGYERASKSDTLDKTRSEMNESEFFWSGKQFWDAMEAEAAEYRVQVKGKTKTGEEIIRTKGLQHNAVIGWAVIYNPPAEVCADWTQEQYDKFFKDCRASMAEISPIFREENRKMSAVHWDEGIPPEEGKDPDGHVHDLGVCKDENGHYCGKLIDAKLLVKINEEFPQKMRERGWDMEDLDTTDFERAKTDSEYREERNAKRKKSGLSVNKHLKHKTMEKADEASALLEQENQLNDDASQRMELASDLMSEADAMQQYAKQIVSEAEEETLTQKAKRNTYWIDAGKYKQEVSALKEERDTLSKEIEDRKKKLADFESEMEAQREAISPTAAGSTEFVLRMLLRQKKFKDDEAAKEALMKFLDFIERFKTDINKQHEAWRDHMRERRHADKMAGSVIEQADREKENGGMEI